MTITIDDELAAKAAENLGDIEEAIDSFLRQNANEPEAIDEDEEYDRRFRAEVQKGIDEADAGLLIPNDAVEAYFAAKRAKLSVKR